MRRPLLRTNQRAGWLLASPWIMGLATTLILLTVFLQASPINVILAVLSAFFLIQVVCQVRKIYIARLSYSDGSLWVALSKGAPIAVPMDMVECVFLGQGPGQIVGLDGEPTEASTLIVRIAESATEFHKREIDHQLGHWCDGYITVNGTWSEPITAEVAGRLNKTIVEIKKELRQAAQESSA
ncbi:MAG: hypothetical protein KDA87_02840 [Planctomycetales bacterium]|nr:hypothetical protein [Planctomycetales bacterium]